MLQVSVLVIGAGPTGLGAATRLEQHGLSSWLIVDKVSHLAIQSLFGSGRAFVLTTGVSMRESDSDHHSNKFAGARSGRSGMHGRHTRGLLV